ncbi:MAG: hypothetical protein RL701_3309 [Pseudomonadota bacterium]|jgi:hypothetical protein
MHTKSRKFSLVGLIASLLTLACAAPQPAASQALRSQTGPYELEVLVNGVTAPTYQHDGETHILGQQGNRYILRVHNRSNRRIEAVVSVDGLDVIDGQAGDFAHKRGYLVPAWGSVDIDGWRLNDREAAAFRFAAIADSYAAKTGRARNVGVIGVAVFPERQVPVPAPRPRPTLVEPERSAAPAEREYDDRSANFSGSGLGRSSDRMESAPAAPAPAAAATGSMQAPQKSSASAESEAKGASADTAQRRARSGLGTEFGEAVASEIRQVQFKRANSHKPAYVIGARYNDRNGLLALGIDVDGDGDDIALRQSASPFPTSERRYARPPTDWRRN